MIVYYMRGKHGHSCAGATHMTKVFVKRTILFLQCGYPLDSMWYLRDFFVALNVGACVLERKKTLMASPFTKPLKTLLGWEDEKCRY